MFLVLSILDQGCVHFFVFLLVCQGLFVPEYQANQEFRSATTQSLVVVFLNKFTDAPQVVYSIQNIDKGGGISNYSVFTSSITQSYLNTIIYSSQMLYLFCYSWIAFLDNNVFSQIGQITKTITGYQTVYQYIQFAQTLSYVPQAAFFLNGVSHSVTPTSDTFQYLFQNEAITQNQVEISIIISDQYEINWFSYSIIYGNSQYLIAGQLKLDALGTSQLFKQDSRTKMSCIGLIFLDGSHGTRIQFSNNFGLITIYTWDTTVIYHVGLAYFQYLPCPLYCTTCYTSSPNCDGCLSTTYRSGSDCTQCQTHMYIITGQMNCQQCGSVCDQCLGDSTNCINCSLATQRMNPPSCTTCPSQMFIQTGLDNCQQCSLHCDQCFMSITNCISCSAFTFKINPPQCLTCPSQMFIQMGIDICQQCAKYCDGCVGTSTNCTNCRASTFRIVPPYCNTCQIKYYKVQKNDICQQCPPLCDTCQDFTSLCLTCNMNSLRLNPPYCLECPQYMFVYQNSCKLCPVACPNCQSDICQICQVDCKTCNNYQCLECALSNYYVSDQNCLSCPAQCSTCTSQTCTSCLPPCYSCNFYGCTACLSGYQLTIINNVVDCQSYCQDLIYHPFEQCNDGNNLAEDGCTDCRIDTGYICQNRVGQISACKQLPIGCLAGSILANQIVCSQCQQGFLLNDNECNINSYDTQSTTQIQTEPQGLISINSIDGQIITVSYHFLNIYVDNDIAFRSNVSYQHVKLWILEINIDNYDNSDFTYNQSYDQQLYLHFNFSKSISKLNLLNIQLHLIMDNHSWNINFLIQPNTIAILNQEQMDIQQNIQTSTQTLRTYVFVAMILTPVLGGFDSIILILDQIAWLSTFYYINVIYPYNVNWFLSVVSFNYIFLDMPQITTPLNQESDPYYFISPYKFMQNCVDPLFLNNILQPALSIISVILIYFLAKLYFKIYKTKNMQNARIFSNIIGLCLESMFSQATLYQKYVFSIILQQVNLNMIDIFLASLLQIICNSSYQYWMIQINTTMAITTILAVGGNCYHLYLQTKKHELIIKRVSFKQSYEPIYKGLKVNQFQHRLFGLLLLYSKIAYTTSLVVFYNKPILQTLFCTISYLLVFLYIIFYNPYKNNKALLEQGVPNLCLFGILVVAVLLACNEEMNMIENIEVLGWVILGFVAISMSMQIFFLLTKQGKKLIEILKFIKRRI